MTRLPVRLTLLLVCVSAVGYAAFLIWSSEQHVRAADNSSRQFHVAARSMATGIAELRAAEQAYVAVGQGEDFWFARVSGILADLHDKLAAMKAHAAATDAVVAADEASGALQDFEQMDRRARDYTRNHQLTLASDLVFTDGFDLTRKASDAIERGVTSELMYHDRVTADVRRKELTALGGAAGVATLGLLLLLPTGRKREEPRAIPTTSIAPRTVSKATSDDPQAPKVVDRPAAPTARVASAPARPAIDLGGMAALCVDLARVQETRALPSLLERAAGILNASGIVLWIADPDGRELSPIVVHGYSAQLATRFGTIAREAENVTALAYRTGLLQTMKGDAVSNGAAAAPLVSGNGTVGVMAIEMKDGGEQQEALLAAATILASQLATLVGPPSARARTEAAG